MGYSKREMEASERRYEKAGTVHAVLLAWQTVSGQLLVDFLHPRSREPLTLQRRWPNPDVLRNLVNRSLTPIGQGPRGLLIERSIAAGRGELEIHVDGEQYARILRR